MYLFPCRSIGARFHMPLPTDSTFDESFRVHLRPLPPGTRFWTASRNSGGLRITSGRNRLPGFKRKIIVFHLKRGTTRDLVSIPVLTLGRQTARLIL
jgi:hypothetical protein